MYKANVEKRLKNLNSIKSMVEIAKFDAIQKISKSSKVAAHHLESASIARDVLSLGKAKEFFKERKKQKKNKLFIYISIPSNLIKVSYQSINKRIDYFMDKENDSIIVVGKPAIDYANKKKLNIVKSYYEFGNSANEITSLLNDYIQNPQYSEILIVSKIDKLISKPLILYPLKISKDNKKKYSKLKFYTSLSDSFKNIAATYCLNIIKNVYEETFSLFYKELLVKHENSITKIDEKIELLRHEMFKMNRKKETEEMIQITQFAKRK